MTISAKPPIGPRTRIVTARRQWHCGTTFGLRVFDSGPVPPGHTPIIVPGAAHVTFHKYGESMRMCEACAKAAGVMP